MRTMNQKTVKTIWKIVVIFVAIAMVLGLAMPFFSF